MMTTDVAGMEGGEGSALPPFGSLLLIAADNSVTNPIELKLEAGTRRSPIADRMLLPGGKLPHAQSGRQNVSSFNPFFG